MQRWRSRRRCFPVGTVLPLIVFGLAASFFDRHPGLSSGTHSRDRLAMLLRMEPVGCLTLKCLDQKE
jgi:hypothetical protein